MGCTRWERSTRVLVSCGRLWGRRNPTAVHPLAQRIPNPSIGNQDEDGDGVNNNIENALGSNPSSNTSTPEHHAMYTPSNDPCADQVDNDGDNLMDREDPDCFKPPLIMGAFPGAGADLFASRATVQLDPEDPGSATEFFGPVVIDRRRINKMFG